MGLRVDGHRWRERALEPAPGGGAEQTVEEHGGQHADDEADRPRRRVLRLDEPTAEGPERQAPSVRAGGERGEAAERGEVEREGVPAVLPGSRARTRPCPPTSRPTSRGRGRRCGSGRTRADRRARTRRRRGAGATAGHRPSPRRIGDAEREPAAHRRDGRARRRRRTGCARDPGPARGCPRTRPPARGPPTRRSRRGSGPRCASGVDRRPGPPQSTSPRRATPSARPAARKRRRQRAEGERDGARRGRPRAAARHERGDQERERHRRGGPGDEVHQRRGKVVALADPVGGRRRRAGSRPPRGGRPRPAVLWSRPLGDSRTRGEADEASCPDYNRRGVPSPGRAKGGESMAKGMGMRKEKKKPKKSKAK